MTTDDVHGQRYIRNIDKDYLCKHQYFLHSYIHTYFLHISLVM